MWSGIITQRALLMFEAMKFLSVGVSGPHLMLERWIGVGKFVPRGTLYFRANMEILDFLVS